ncbi:hypothetical protein H6G06_18415 [Anabaena sphaerica FACHB-251]|uniref:Thioredoxin domain-containing protein n=1 Tax=Anabaena sphaerica FACHB-251 TaxID=2692883 RepID=A0A926WJM3_9NOST|nr:hypothetical protein [Anabaena sphaerica]MBD2295390.1 hypothetical protein [Anabaena sphaerica FACHB-251]
MKYPIITFSLAATLGLFTTIATAEETQLSCSVNSQNLITNKTLKAEKAPPIKNSSGAAEIALAKHLKKIKAKMYGAFWCPHCHHQQELFGKQAWTTITYIECDPKGTNPRPDLCEKAKIQGYPTWEIKGKLYPGTQSLENLSQISGYKGKRNFKN